MWLLFHVDLQQAISKSFSPEPEVMLVTQVHDTKEWMQHHIPSLHDHLKAHQFKFEKKQGEEVRMFYKEWSGDTFWLPQSGIPLLMAHESRLCPTGSPKLLTPCYDQESTLKLQATIAKLGAYLAKSGASEWWENWLQMAMQTGEKEQPCARGE